MTSKERLQTVLSHKDADRIALDFGATTVTGLHCIIVEKLREYYGLERRPVRIIDPFQMLGEVDDELLDLIGIDTIGIWGRKICLILMKRDCMNKSPLGDKLY